MTNNQQTPASKQAKSFNKHQNRISSTREGFTNANLVPKSKKVLQNTDESSRENLRQEYNKTLEEYNQLLTKLSGDTSDYLNRTNANNPYSNKTVRFTTGHIAYVTNQGIVKYVPSTEIWDSIGISKEAVQLDIPWIPSYDIPNAVLPTMPPLITGTPLIKGQSVGNEGSNVYVNKLVTNTEATYQGCYADNGKRNAMSFVNGSPSSVSPIINGNFSQPTIEKKTYQYINNQTTLPGWDFNAVLLNESNDWGYPMPYPNGTQCASLQNEQKISQIIKLNIGTYSLAFTACGRKCCDSSNESNPINVLLNDQVVYSIQPPVDAWTNYKTNINVTTSGNNTITIQGTWTSTDRSTAIQGITIETDETKSGGNYTYDQCKQTAIDGGYPFFALQDVNYSTNKGYCALSNNDVAVKRNGNSYIMKSGIPIWSSRTIGQPGNTATLTNDGSLVILNSSDATAFSTPSKGAVNYIGCYGDKSNKRVYKSGWSFPFSKKTVIMRSLPLQDDSSHKYNRATCEKLAQDKGNTYYSLQDSKNGENAQCGISNDLPTIKQYGKSSNCTQLEDGSWTGGWYSNAVYSLNPDEMNNYYLILQDDGNMCIYRGSGPQDSQDLIWSAETAGKQRQPNQQYAAAKGTFGTNWIPAGASLAAGDTIGSNDGSIYLVMQTNGDLVLYTSEQVLNCKKMKDSNMGGGVKANALYKLNETGYTSNMSKVAYIDPNSILFSYPQSGLANDYTEIQGYDSAGNDIPGASYGNTTADSCKETCNANENCYGFVYNPEQSACYPKDKNMYPNTPKTMNPNGMLYVRNKQPSVVPMGVSPAVTNIDSIKYQQYVNSGKEISDSYGLKNSTSVQRQQLEQLKSKLNLLSNQIVSSTGKLSSGETDVNERIQSNIQSVEGFTNNGYLTQLKETQEKINNYTRNMDNIVNNSEIVVLQHNFEYLLWSVLAIGTVILSMNIIRKQ